MIKFVEKKRWLWILFFSALLFGSQMMQSQSSMQDDTDTGEKENEQLEEVTGSYCGYVASFKTGESQVDIGSSLSELTFVFDRQSVRMEYEFLHTGLVDTSGDVEARDYSKEGDRVEMRLELEHIGDVRVVGTITEKDFTGKIYLPWRGKYATMNFITTKGSVAN